MTTEERKGIRNFVDRMEAFLLTHDDDHLVAIGVWLSAIDVRCPVGQITGSSGQCVAAEVLLSGPSLDYCRVREAIVTFISTYDSHPSTEGLRSYTKLGPVRKAIEAGIANVRIKYEVEEEPALSENRILVTI